MCLRSMTACPAAKLQAAFAGQRDSGTFPCSAADPLCGGKHGCGMYRIRSATLCRRSVTASPGRRQQQSSERPSRRAAGPGGFPLGARWPLCRVQRIADVAFRIHRATLLCPKSMTVSPVPGRRRCGGRPSRGGRAGGTPLAACRSLHRAWRRVTRADRMRRATLCRGLMTASLSPGQRCCRGRPSQDGGAGVRPLAARRTPGRAAWRMRRGWTGIHSAEMCPRSMMECPAPKRRRALVGRRDWGASPPPSGEGSGEGRGRGATAGRLRPPAADWRLRDSGHAAIRCGPETRNMKEA